MDTAAAGIRDAIDGATAAELRGLLVALEGRVVDVGKQFLFCTARNTVTARLECMVHRQQRIPMITLRQVAE